MALYTHVSAVTSLQKTALVVGPELQLAAQVSSTLPGWKIERTVSNQTELPAVEEHAFGLIVTGEQTQGNADVELLRQIRRVWPHTRLIILTG